MIKSPKNHQMDPHKTSKKKTLGDALPSSRVSQHTALLKKTSLTKKRSASQKGKNSQQTPEHIRTLVDFIVQKLDAGKAENIVTIDLVGKTSFADYMVIASGTSSRHVMGLVHNLIADLKKKGYKPHVDGETGDGNWVVIDLIDVMVHVFTPETRDFYQLESIWKPQ